MSVLEELGEIGNPYKWLHVDSTATEPKLRKAYRKRALGLHPDKLRDDPGAAAKFAKLKKAYEFLCDPVKRGKYDAHLKTIQERDTRAELQSADKRRLKEKLEAREQEFKKSKSNVAPDEGSASKVLDELRKANEELMRRQREKSSAWLQEQASTAVQTATHTSAPATTDCQYIMVQWDIEDPTISEDFLRHTFSNYNPTNVEVQFPGGARIDFTDREWLLRALLYFKQGRKRFPFKVAMGHGEPPRADTNQVWRPHAPSQECPFNTLNNSNLADREKTLLDRLRQKAASTSEAPGDLPNS